MVRVVAAPAVSVVFAMLPPVGAVLPPRRPRSPVGLRAIAGASSNALASAATTAAGVDRFEPVE